ncbi:hypothetical protein [Desulfomicrobium baculatum]|uniref:hypothetical protein n=1 Tax=Desulfomicrobium baculatum TaxID=899 RepID=UPI00019E6466|nr:hypothetical protein [Desulfomicrobium baculatum]
MKKDLVAKVIAVVLLAGVFGCFAYDEALSDIGRMEMMSVIDVAKEAMKPAFESKSEAIFLFIACGLTIIVITELLGFFIRVIFFRKIDETNIVHNHNITLQIPSNIGVSAKNIE